MIEHEHGSLKNIITRLIHNCKSIRQLDQIYSQVIISPNLSPYDRSFLISRLLFYLCTVSKSLLSLTYANKIFKRIPDRTLFVFNALIRANANRIDNPSSRESLILYKQMLGNGLVPDCITLPFVLKECWRRFDGLVGQSIHGHAVKFGHKDDVYVQNGLINLYCECGMLGDARRVFDEMPNKDVVSWNSIIMGYLRIGEIDAALEFFSAMNERKNIITWNSIITGLVQGGRAKDALEFFHEMQISRDEKNVVRPDKVTVTSAISACASLGAIDQGRWVHGYFERSGMDCDLVMGTALVDMYGKCGCVGRAFEVFKGMPDKDVLAWTAMISAFSLHGYGIKAFQLFTEMERAGVRPNAVTFVSLLSACAHSGLVEKGCWYFEIMTQVHHIEPQLQHYACMIDIFGRAGLFTEAEKLIRSMPMKPDVFVWGALLGACQQHRNFELGEKVAQHLIDLEPHNHAFYVTLCDLYAKSERFDDRKKIRYLMKGQEVLKSVPGSSMIEVDGVVHEFSVNGSPEILMKDIQSVLMVLSNEMKMEMKVA